MDAFRQYVISVTCAAILSGILMSVVKKGPSKELIKIVIGLFLAGTLLKPLPGLEINLEEGILGRALSEGNSIANEGYQRSQTELLEIIETELESNIIREAESLNLQIETQVYLRTDEPWLPESVNISGTIAPYAKIQLENYITSELGIAKENLHWTG